GRKRVGKSLVLKEARAVRGVGRAVAHLVEAEEWATTMDQPIDLGHLHPAPGATRPRKRVGRGPGSGQGKTAGRGHKGRRSRSGGNSPPGYEGGQMPLQRRLPKRGFRPVSRVPFAVVNLGQLAAFPAGSTVGPEELRARGLV